jgi:hypothetical protein
MGRGSSLPPATASPLALAHEAVATEDGPHPPVELVSAPAGFEIGQISKETVVASVQSLEIRQGL